MYRSLTPIISSFMFLATAVLYGQQSPPTELIKEQVKDEAKPQAVGKTKADEPVKDKGKVKTSTDEEPVITHHSMRVDGKVLAYTATAGLMPIKDSKGDVEARIFYMAYTVDAVSPINQRPLMFSFNGGPGSASVWLHLGTLGPRRVKLTDEPTIPSPPFSLVENEATWLDRTDLVFIDPVGTGFSRAAKPELNSKFHALHGDITSVGEFIRMYLSRYDRWASPLYLIGESYGTTRAAGLAGHLVDQGIAFNGLVLISCALDFQGFVFSQGNDIPFLTYLPSYAASAWYHKKLPADLQQTELSAVLSEVEQWTDRDYASILARGDRLSANERHNAAAKLARYTGLSASDIDANNLRIEMSHFCKDGADPESRAIFDHVVCTTGKGRVDWDGDTRTRTPLGVQLE
jgi:carboxypeptidase C (cathepsin A)